MHLGIELTDERLIIGQLRGMCHLAFQINKARSVVLPAKSSPQMWSCCYVRLSLRIVVVKRPSLRQPWLLEQDGGPSKGSRRRSLTTLRGKSHSHWQGAFSSRGRTHCEYGGCRNNTNKSIPISSPFSVLWKVVTRGILLALTVLCAMSNGVEVILEHFTYSVIGHKCKAWFVRTCIVLPLKVFPAISIMAWHHAYGKPPLESPLSERCAHSSPGCS